MRDETIVRADTHANIPWFQVSRKLAQDSRLSFDHRGLMLYLLSKPANWRVSHQDIMREGNIGRDKTQRLIKELQEFGYAEYVNERNESGVFTGGFYRVYDLPELMPPTGPLKNRTPAEPDPGKTDTYNKESTTVERGVHAHQRQRHRTPEHILAAKTAGLSAVEMRALVDAVLDVTGKRALADGDGVYADRALASAQECGASLLQFGVTTPAQVKRLCEVFANKYPKFNEPSFGQLVEIAAQVGAVKPKNDVPIEQFEFGGWDG